MRRIFMTGVLSGTVALVSLSSVSCETTGDPTTGGIFWSEAKAQDRLAERQQRLEHIERKTSSTNKRSAETRRRIKQLQ